MQWPKGKVFCSIVITLSLTACDIPPKFSSNAFTECQKRISDLLDKTYRVRYNKETFRVIKQGHTGFEINRTYLYNDSKLIKQSIYLCYINSRGDVASLNSITSQQLTALLSNTRP